MVEKDNKGAKKEARKKEDDLDSCRGGCSHRGVGEEIMAQSRG